MRKFLVLAAAAASTLAMATPAAAQYYPQQYGYNGSGYNGYGYNGSGYNGSGYNDFSNLQYRIDRLRSHINQFDRSNVISNGEARSLRAAAYDLERQLRYSGNGYGVEQRLAQLEQRVDYIASRYRYGRYDYRNGNDGNNHNWSRGEDHRNYGDHDDD